MKMFSSIAQIVIFASAVTVVLSNIGVNTEVVEPKKPKPAIDRIFAKVKAWHDNDEYYKRQAYRFFVEAVEYATPKERELLTDFMVVMRERRMHTLHHHKSALEKKEQKALDRIKIALMRGYEWVLDLLAK